MADFDELDGMWSLPEDTSTLRPRAPAPDLSIPLGGECVCPMCEITFKKVRIKQVFCSDACRRIYMTPGNWMANPYGGGFKR